MEHASCSLRVVPARLDPARRIASQGGRHAFSRRLGQEGRTAARAGVRVLCQALAAHQPAQRHAKEGSTSHAPHPQSASYHVVDVFACSLDQVGLLEMKELVEATGGLMVLGDSFGQSVFKESLRRVFTTYPEDVPQDGGTMSMAFGGSLEVLTSREFKVSGAIGPVSSLEKNGSNVSDLEVGVGGTNAWSLGGIDPSTTIAVYFDVTNPGNTPLPEGKRRYIQFLTKYQHANGRTRLRATTMCGPWHNMPPHDANAQQQQHMGGMMHDPVQGQL